MHATHWRHHPLRSFFVQFVRITLTVNIVVLHCPQVCSSPREKTTITMAGVLKNLWKIFSGGEEEVDNRPKYDFPESIEAFGYVFNDKGQLVNKDDMTGRYIFNVKEDNREYNQQHYDALGELITEYLYEKMETDLKLQKIYLPLDAKKEEPQSFIFRSHDALSNPDKLMVFINGGGVVRAGQWSRKLIINEDIDTGTQFPYIRRAIADGYGILVMNTNMNKAVVNGKIKEIRENGSAEKHGMYVWRYVMSTAKAKNIVVVAHSYGGVVLCKVAEKFMQDFVERVFCVVFTDSVHSADRTLYSKYLKDYLKQRGVNFASTYVPINFIMQSSSPDDLMSVSAGTREHERTSHACIDSAFKFIRENYQCWIRDNSFAPRHDFKPLPEDLSMYSPAKEWERKADEAVAKKKAEDERKRKSAEQKRLSEQGGQDQKPEAAPETAPKAASETAPKAASETAPEAAPETAPEAASETAPEAAPETAPKAASETAPEAAPEAAPETGTPAAACLTEGAKQEEDKKEKVELAEEAVEEAQKDDGDVTTKADSKKPTETGEHQPANKEGAEQKTEETVAPEKPTEDDESQKCSEASEVPQETSPAESREGCTKSKEDGDENKEEEFETKGDEKDVSMQPGTTVGSGEGEATTDGPAKETAEEKKGDEKKKGDEGKKEEATTEL